MPLTLAGLDSATRLFGLITAEAVTLDFAAADFDFAFVFVLAFEESVRELAFGASERVALAFADSCREALATTFFELASDFFFGTAVLVMRLELVRFAIDRLLCAR